jgi:hypothetical protein
VPTTAKGIRYPALTDPANVPLDMGNLASDVDGLLGVKVPAVVNGQWLKGVGGAAVWSAIGTADLPTGIPVANLAPSGTNGQVLTTVSGASAWAAAAAGGGGAPVSLILVLGGSPV